MRNLSCAAVSNFVTVAAAAVLLFACSALTLLVGHQEEHLASKKIE